MVEFNADGSLKLPRQFQEKKDDEENKMKFQNFIKIKKDVTSFKSPKECMLRLTLSNKITDKRFIEYIYNEWNQRAETPSKITKAEDEYNIKIGTSFRRCSECTSLINRYREHLNGNLILEQGNCPFEGRKKDFCYEDYFD